MEETIIPFPEPLAPLTRVRSTLLVASLTALKDRGLIDRYYACLPREDRASVTDLSAGTWIPARTAEAHYAACDALALTPLEIEGMGNAVGVVTARVFMQLVLRTAREVGATPWVILGNSPRYWGRYYEGSAVALTKLGPKEARLEVRASSLAAYSYWRGALRSILYSLAVPFCQKAYVRELSPPSRSGAAYRLSWV